MSKLSKYQRLRTCLKITNKKNTIICLEIMPHKIQIPHQSAFRENSHQNAQSLQIHGRFTQKSVKTMCPTETTLPRNQAKCLHFTRLPLSKKPSSQRKQSTGLFLSGFHKRRAPAKTLFQIDRFAVFKQDLADNKRINK